MIDDELLDSILPVHHAQRLRLALRPYFSSAEFCAFVRDHKTSIGSLLRKQRQIEDCFDVVAELLLARLLAPHAARLDYQVSIAPSGRCLDFVAEWQDGSFVGVEVKRIREPLAVLRLQGEGLFDIPYTQRESFKFTDVLLNALKQLHPKIPNVVFIQVDSCTHEPAEVLDAIRHIARAFWNRDSEFFVRKGFSGRDAFLSSYRSLSLVVVRSRWIGLPGTRTSAARNLVLPIPDASIGLAKDVVQLFQDADVC